MSGPKTGRYTLTPEQRRRLAEQLRKAREEQIRREKLEAAKRILKEQQEKALEFLKAVMALPDAGEEMTLLAKKMKTVLEECERVNSTERIEKVIETRQRLAVVSDELQLSLNLYLNKQYEKKLMQIQAEDVLISKGFSVLFRKIEDKQKLARDISFRKIQEALNSLGRMQLSAYSIMELERIREIAGNIESLDFLDNFYAITVYPFVAKCKEYDDQYNKYFEQYSEILAEYRTLMAELNEDSDQKFEEFSIENMEELRVLVNQMQDEIMKSREEEYISVAIDEAMVEMGYALVGTRDIVKKSGKKTHKELYHFSDGTVVDVTYSSTGQISMELGAVDSIDRVPTSTEASRLTEDMTVFCDEYAKLEKILERRGILRKNIQLLPPSAEYAQVINTEDYDMKQPIEKYSAEKIARTREKGKYRSIGAE